MGLLCGLIEHYSRQNEDSSLPFSIGVIEQGKGPPHDESTLDVSNWFKAAHVPTSSSKIYSSAPQKGLNGRIVDIPCGIGLGGSTNVNACLISKPLWDHDFKHWPGVFNAKTNLMKDAILHLEEIMSSNKTITTKSVCSSYLDICSGVRTNPQQNAKESDKHSQHPSIFHTTELLQKSSISRTVINQDPRSESITNRSSRNYLHSMHISAIPRSSPISSTSLRRDFVRVNYFDALLSPLLRGKTKMKSQITFVKGTEVQRIIIKNKTAIGVECRHVTGDDEKYNRSITKYKQSESTFIIRASKQVILCSGAIISPVLLMVSGIGDSDQLKNAGIKNIAQHIPKVGCNLRDHVIIPRAFFTPLQSRIELSLNAIQGFYCVQEVLNDTSQSLTNDGKNNKYTYELALTDGALSSIMIPHFIASLIRRDNKLFTKNLPNGVQTVFVLISQLLFALVKSTLSFIMARIFKPTQITATLNLCLLNPQSAGKIYIEPKSTTDDNRHSRIHTNNVDDVPQKDLLSNFDLVIDPSYLTHPSDIQMLVQGWKASDIVAQHHFGASIEILPGPIVRGLGRLHSFICSTDDVVKKANLDEKDGEVLGGLWLHAKEFSCPYYHWCGTCQMGNTNQPNSKDEMDEDFVVDEKLRVQGIHGLRVCDASVFPSCVSSPTALTCSSVGYVFAQILADEFTSSSS